MPDPGIRVNRTDWSVRVGGDAKLPVQERERVSDVLILDFILSWARKYRERGIYRNLNHHGSCDRIVDSYPALNLYAHSLQDKRYILHTRSRSTSPPSRPLPVTHNYTTENGRITAHRTSAHRSLCAGLSQEAPRPRV